MTGYFQMIEPPFFFGCFYRRSQEIVSPKYSINLSQNFENKFGICSKQSVCRSFMNISSSNSKLKQVSRTNGTSFFLKFSSIWLTVTYLKDYFTVSAKFMRVPLNSLVINSFRELRFIKTSTHFFTATFWSSLFNSDDLKALLMFFLAISCMTIFVFAMKTF